MSDESTPKPFWSSLPGVLTGIAAVLTALTGLLALFLNRTPAKSPDSTPTDRVLTGSPEHHENPSHASSEAPDLAGRWRDLVTGTTVRIRQNGHSLWTQTSNPITGQVLANGEGLIKGKTVKGFTQWLGGARYTVLLIVSENAKDISGTATTLTGQIAAVHLVRG